MVRYHNFDIVFAEIPGETTLAFNITNCPNRCPGCHSPHLTADEGRVLDDAELLALLTRGALYAQQATAEGEMDKVALALIDGAIDGQNAWEQVEAGLRNSLWWRQVGVRSRELGRQIVTGRYMVV